MKAVKKIFRFISLTLLYLGFSGLAGVFGVLLYGITHDFVSNQIESRGLASVQSNSPKTIQSPPKTNKKNVKAPVPNTPNPPQPLKTAEVTNQQASPSTPPAVQPNQPQPITASEVKDEKSLQSFVLRAKKHLEKDYDRALEDFKTNEMWKTSFTYLSILDLSGTILFNANHPHIEGENGMDWKNKDGKKIITDIVNIGKNGNGFYECRIRHPDTETLHPALHYITSFKTEENPLIVVSSFFLKEPPSSSSEKE
ncbi:MAG: cache domain-containing protein [Bdellovibrionales bacterium]|nr:cache domain-containing protein [Bdellovibrionales bacterium]